MSLASCLECAPPQEAASDGHTLGRGAPPLPAAGPIDRACMLIAAIDQDKSRQATASTEGVLVWSEFSKNRIGEKVRKRESVVLGNW